MPTSLAAASTTRSSPVPGITGAVPPPPRRRVRLEQRDRVAAGAEHPLAVTDATDAERQALAAGQATDALTDAMRLKRAIGIVKGAESVRLLGGPFFERFADDLITQAARVQDGGPTGPAISAAMDGASWLLKRASHLG
jgi:hypothetical protein